MQFRADVKINSEQGFGAGQTWQGSGSQDFLKNCSDLLEFKMGLIDSGSDLALILTPAPFLTKEASWLRLRNPESGSNTIRINFLKFEQ